MDITHLWCSHTKCCNYNFQFASELRAIKCLEIQWEVVAGGSLPANDSSLVYQQNFIFRTDQVQTDKKILSFKTFKSRNRTRTRELTSQLILKPRLAFLIFSDYYVNYAFTIHYISQKSLSGNLFSLKIR